MPDDDGDDGDKKKVIEVIIQSGKTGSIGDGKIVGTDVAVENKDKQYIAL